MNLLTKLMITDDGPSMGKPVYSTGSSQPILVDYSTLVRHRLFTTSDHTTLEGNHDTDTLS